MKSTITRLADSSVYLAYALSFIIISLFHSSIYANDKLTKRVVSDPSVVAKSGYCFNNYIWNGTQARVYYPSNGGCSKSVYSPLVVILHAAGNNPKYSHTDYDYLQQHLARNGFISASIGVVANSTSGPHQTAAAQKAWDFVEDFLWSTWSKRFYINPNSIALIGHSRGGDTVRYLAEQLANDDLFKVRSVVSMAPVGGNGDYISGLDTEAYLQLYGTKDLDTSPRETFTHFDNVGSNFSQLDPIGIPEVLYKAVKLLHEGTHQGYSDLGFAVSQRETVKGYILAFLAAHNTNNVTWYEDYIRGDLVPGNWLHPVFTSYSDGFYRRVIDNFDDGNVAISTLGGFVTTFKSTAQVLDLSDFGVNYVHDTHAMWTWGSSDGSLVSWTIPVSKRNVSAFKWLSLRIAQTSGDPSKDLRIQVRNGNVWSPELRLTDYGPIAQPTEMCFFQFGGPCSIQHHMATIRIPLGDFGAHNNVQHVRLRFRGDSIPLTFVVDNLEFSEWIFKP